METSGLVFISYAHEDRAFTERLSGRLRKAGYAVWYDESLRGGQDWPEEIARQLESASVCVVVWSPDAAASDWVKEEMHYARTVVRIPVILLMYRDAGLPFGFSRSQYIDFRHGRDGFAELCEALAAMDVPQETPFPPNPFVPLAGRIEDLRCFFDREREIQHVLDVLNGGASVALVGERAVGKSSLLWAVYHRLEEQPDLLGVPRRPIYLDLQTVYDEDDLYAALCEHAGVPQAKGYRLTRALRGKHFLLMLDEVEKMTWKGFSRHVRAQLRGLAEGDDAPLRFILTAHTPLDRLFPDSREAGATSPLAGICQQIDVVPWDAATARAFIRDRLEPTPVRFREEEVERLIRESGGHPQTLMRLCHEVYARYVQVGR